MIVANFGKGDTAQAVPQAPRLRSMTFDGKTRKGSCMTLIGKTEQTSCCDSLRSFEYAVSSRAYLGFIVKRAFSENISRYWIKPSTSFSSITFTKKSSFWNLCWTRFSIWRATEQNIQNLL